MRKVKAGLLGFPSLKHPQTTFWTGNPTQLEYSWHGGWPLLASLWGLSLTFAKPGPLCCATAGLPRTSQGLLIGATLSFPRWWWVGIN